MRPSEVRPDTFLPMGSLTGLSLASPGFLNFARYPKSCSPLPHVSLTDPRSDSQASLSRACSITGPGFFSGRQGGQLGLSRALCPALITGVRGVSAGSQSPRCRRALTPVPSLSSLSFTLSPSPLLPQASQLCPRCTPHSSPRGLSYHLHHSGSLGSCGGADSEG